VTVNLTPVPESPKGNARGSGYERNTDDWYVEPIGAVVALLGAERFWGTIVDPACGGGNIPKVCEAAGLKCFGYDLVDRGYGEQADYLTQDFSWADHLISNPPYELLEQFALKAIDEIQHKVALLVRLSWLEGEGRYRRIFEPHPPSRVLVFRNRISCPPGGTEVKAKGGAVAYAWVIFDKGHRGPTQLDWIRAG